MKNYVIRELENVYSYREGTLITAKSLRSAMNQASKMQMFQGTVLVINDSEDISTMKADENVVAIKYPRSKWKRYDVDFCTSRGE